MNTLKGWRTFALGLAVAVGPAALQYLVGVDWSTLVSPSVATAIAGALMVAMRVVTSTPPGQS